jgi:DNA-binding transcriptional LysR family regulator
MVEAVVRYGSVTRAAQMLNVSQPSLTRGLKLLETQIGTPLFERGRLGADPSPAAEIMLRRNEKIQANIDRLLNAIERIQRLETGKLTVATSLWPAVNSVETSVARLATLYPRMPIEIVQSGWRACTERILAGEIDLGVLELEQAKTIKDFAIEALNTQQAYFFVRAGHPLQYLDPLQLTDIAKFPFVGTAWTTRMADYYAEHAPEFGIMDPRTGISAPRVVVGNFGSIRNIVLNSDAVGVCIPSVIAADIALGQLTLLDRLVVPQLRSNYGFVHRKDRTLSPAVLAFMDMVRRVEAEKQPELRTQSH